MSVPRADMIAAKVALTLVALISWPAVAQGQQSTDPGVREATIATAPVEERDLDGNPLTSGP